MPRSRRNASILSALAALPALTLAQTRAAREGPPGLVRIEAGATQIGTSRESAQAVAERNEFDFAVIVYETPRHSLDLDDFLLMVTEVTNEQYEAFVRDTDRRPPQSWGAAAIERARDVRVLEISEQLERIRAAGGKPPEYPAFDATGWWAANWRNEPWSVAAHDAARPVTFVNYDDVVDYARWTGLRPMTEFEFQRAGRGRGIDQYPWGDDPDPSRASTSELVLDGKKVLPDRPFAVGSFPRGANSDGVFDLSGNVWEWTSSPFIPYLGYRDIVVEVGAGKQRRTIHPLPDWNAEQRVVVGGCFLTGTFAARLSTRRPTERAQATDSLGFRCAASVQPGVDTARAVLDHDWPEDQRPQDVLFDPRKLLAAERWRSVAGSAKSTTATDAAGEPAPLPGYAVITEYDHLIFVPVVELDVVSVQTLEELSRRRGNVPLGLLSTSIEVLEPALPAGSYLIAYRSGRAPQKDTDWPEGFDASVDSLLFFDVDGKALAARAVPELAFVRPPAPTLTLADGSLQRAGEPTEQPTTVATLSVGTWAKLSNRGLVFALPLAFRAGEIDSSWRY